MLTQKMAMPIIAHSIAELIGLLTIERADAAFRRYYRNLSPSLEPFSDQLPVALVFS